MELERTIFSRRSITIRRTGEETAEVTVAGGPTYPVPARQLAEMFREYADLDFGPELDWFPKDEAIRFYDSTGSEIARVDMMERADLADWLCSAYQPDELAAGGAPTAAQVDELIAAAAALVHSVSPTTLARLTSVLTQIDPQLVARDGRG